MLEIFVLKAPKTAARSPDVWFYCPRNEGRISRWNILITPDVLLETICVYGLCRKSRCLVEFRNGLCHSRCLHKLKTSSLFVMFMFTFPLLCRLVSSSSPWSETLQSRCSSMFLRRVLVFVRVSERCLTCRWWILCLCGSFFFTGSCFFTRQRFDIVCMSDFFFFF